MNETQIKIPIWFWIVVAILLIWNLMGIANFFMQISLSEEDIIALPESQQLYYDYFPLWIQGAFALGVFGGTWGSIGLLLKKKWAMPLFIASMIGILVQMTHNLIIALSHEAMLNEVATYALIIISVGLIAIWLTKYATGKNWIK